MRKILATAFIAALLAIGNSTPSFAQDFECQSEQTVGKHQFCGVLSAADISNDGKYIYAVEQDRVFLSTRAEEYSQFDLPWLYRIVRIEVASGDVTTVLDWQAPSPRFEDLGENDTRFSSEPWRVDLSPDGRSLLILLSVIKQTFSSGSLAMDSGVRTEMAILDLQSGKLTNLSENLSLRDSKEVNGFTYYETIGAAYWTSNSKDVRFVVYSEDFNKLPSNQAVSIASPTKSKAAKVQNLSYISANSKFGTTGGTNTGSAHRLINLTTGKTTAIKGTARFANWAGASAVLPKDSGKSFFAVFSDDDYSTGFAAGAVYSVDSKGKRKLILKDEMGIESISYAEKGKLLLIQSNSYGLVVVRG